MIIYGMGPREASINMFMHKSRISTGLMVISEQLKIFLQPIVALIGRCREQTRGHIRIVDIDNCTPLG
jgi:hypothetical protein